MPVVQKFDNLNETYVFVPTDVNEPTESQTDMVEREPYKVINTKWKSKYKPKGKILATV